MTKFALTIAQVRKFSPCDERLGFIDTHLPARRKITAAQARDFGCTLNDLVWIASAVARNDKAVERRVCHWLADIAARVLHIYERDYPADTRVRASIEAARDFADGHISGAAVAAAGVAAGAAAVAAAGAAAGAAAVDAAWVAAGVAARAAAVVAARAAAVAAAWDAAGVAAWDAAVDAAGVAAWDAAWSAEEAWQFDRLIAWLSEDEPTPLALPEPARIAA